MMALPCTTDCSAKLTRYCCQRLTQTLCGMFDYQRSLMCQGPPVRRGSSPLRCCCWRPGPAKSRPHSCSPGSHRTPRRQTGWPLLHGSLLHAVAWSRLQHRRYWCQDVDSIPCRRESVGVEGGTSRGVCCWGAGCSLSQVAATGWSNLRSRCSKASAPEVSRSCHAR